MQVTTYGQTVSPVPGTTPPASSTPAPPANVPAPPVTVGGGGSGTPPTTAPPVTGTTTSTTPPSQLSGQPVLMDKLKPKDVHVFQSIEYNRARKEYYSAQTMAGSNGSDEPYQTTLVTRYDDNGNYLDQMKINDAGHGTGLVVENYGSKNLVYLWLPINNQANKYFRFLYKSGTFSFSNLPSRTEIPRFTSAYVTYHVDWLGDVLLERRTPNDANMQYFKRKLSEVLKGIDKVYGAITIPTPYDRQGFAALNDVAYSLQGAANGEYLNPPQPSTLVTYSWANGGIVDTMNLQSLGQVNGNWKDNWHEPEGLSVYRDPTTKKGSLILSIVTGVPKNHDWFVYRFTNIGAAP